MNCELPPTALSELDDGRAGELQSADVDAHDALSVTRTERELSIV